jgi:hypothetical protein
MTIEKDEPTTNELIAGAAAARTRVAADVERLATQLAPAQLKDRALGVAESSLQRFAARALGRLMQSPRQLASYVRRNPLAGVAICAGAGVVAWRLAVRRHR